MLFLLPDVFDNNLKEFYSGGKQRKNKISAKLKCLPRVKYVQLKQTCFAHFSGMRPKTKVNFPLYHGCAIVR